MADLITLDRALEQIPNSGTCDTNKLSTMITACSGVIENYCNRTFAQGTYDELHTITGSTCYLFVDNPPIVQVNQVRGGQLPALYVQCNDPTNQTQEATIRVDSTGVTLTRVYNNVTTVTPFSFVSYPTFQNLGDGINALGNQWKATYSQQFNLWQTADMITEGAWSARNISVPLMVYWWGLPYYRVNEEIGEIYNPGGWLPGYQSYRVNYVGGFDPIPEPVQMACADLVRLVYSASQLDPNLQSETLDKYNYTKNTALKNIDMLPWASKLALNQYRIIPVAKWK